MFFGQWNRRLLIQRSLDYLDKQSEDKNNVRRQAKHSRKIHKLASSFITALIKQICASIPFVSDVRNLFVICGKMLS